MRKLQLYLCLVRLRRINYQANRLKLSEIRFNFVVFARATGWLSVPRKVLADGKKSRSRPRPRPKRNLTLCQATAKDVERISWRSACGYPLTNRFQEAVVSRNVTARGVSCRATIARARLPDSTYNYTCTILVFCILVLHVATGRRNSRHFAFRKISRLSEQKMFPRQICHCREGRLDVSAF